MINYISSKTNGALFQEAVPAVHRGCGFLICEIVVEYLAHCQARFHHPLGLPKAERMKIAKQEKTNSNKI